MTKSLPSGRSPRMQYSLGEHALLINRFYRFNTILPSWLVLTLQLYLCNAAETAAL